MTPSIRAALFIAGKDLHQRARDRSAIVLGFVAPLVISGIMSVAFEGTEDFHATVGYVDEDHSELAAAFAGVLESPELADVIELERFDTEQLASDALDDGDIDSAIVVPSGFGEAATSAEGGASIVVLSTVDTSLVSGVTQGIAESFVAQVNANRLSVRAALAAGAPAGELDRLIDEAAALRLPAQLVRRPTGAVELKTISYYGPGMAIFFVFFAIAFTARSYFTEKRAGTTDRLAAAPIRPGAIIAGKSLAVFAYGTASLLSMMVSTTLVFGADWGPPVAAVAVCLAIVLAIVAMTAFVIAAARTERQAEGLSSLIVFVLALLGGNFVLQSQLPDVFRTLALLTPNGQALRAFTDLTTSADPGLGLVAGPVLMILAFSAAVIVAAGALNHRAVRQ